MNKNWYGNTLRALVVEKRGDLLLGDLEKRKLLEIL